MSADLWGLQRIGAAKAWDLSTGSKGIKVCVVDSGLDYTHPDLKANVNSVVGVDYVDNDSNPMDEDGHGSHVAGACGAELSWFEELLLG